MSDHKIGKIENLGEHKHQFLLGNGAVRCACGETLVEQIFNGLSTTHRTVTLRIPKGKKMGEAILDVIGKRWGNGRAYGEIGVGLYSISDDELISGLGEA